MIDEKTQSSNSHSSGNGLHPTNDDLPAGIREGNAGLLSLKDLEAQLGDGSSGFYGRLRRFADVPGIGELLGAVNVPGAKGVRYEPRSVDIFRRLLAASTANEVTPATAVAWLKLNKDVQPAQADMAIAEKTQPGNSLMEQGQMGFATKLLSGVLAPITAVLQDLTGAIQGLRPTLQALPAPAPPPDRLLTPEEAAALLACKPRSVSRRVLPVEQNPSRYRESDVFAYMRSCEPITKEQK